MELEVNGTRHTVSHPDEPLLWALHDELGLNGVHYGCGAGICGCCTVLADGQPLRSCQVSARDAAGRSLTTLEGLAALAGATGDELHPVQQAFLENPLQCGWCLPGHVMTAVGLLSRTPDPGPEQIAAEAGRNLCRCGGYTAVRENVARAVQIAREWS